MKRDAQNTTKKDLPRQIERRAMAGDSRRSIAEALGIPEATLRKSKELAEAFNMGKSLRRAAIRQAQFDLAMQGNATMLIWLGKNELGQTDRPREPRGPREPDVDPSMG